MHATHSSDTVARGRTPQTPRTSTPSAALWRCALAAPTAAMAGLLPGATVVALLAALREALAASRSAALRDALLALLAPGEALVALLPAARATRLPAAAEACRRWVDNPPNNARLCLSLAAALCLPIAPAPQEELLALDLAA